MNSKRRENLISVLVCLVIGFICITFASKNSFVYGFQDSRDIQIFLTTARGILDGDVLYRDIFEVKGPYLYLIYVLGLTISPDSTYGIFLIETLLFAAFLFVSYKTVKMYVKNVPACLGLTAIIGFVSTMTYSMDGGGQCEELLLPVLSGIIYIVLKYFKETYPKRIPAKDVLLVSVGFTVIFWMKYTLIGLVLGLVLYLVYVQIRDKTVKNIFYYAGLFIAGMVVTTLPIVIYFTYHNAWASLWDAYFYKLIFTYTPDTYSERNGGGLYFIFQEYIAVSCFTAFGFIYSFIAMLRSKGGEKHMYGSVVAMSFFQAVGMSFSRNWRYTPECMHAFEAVGVAMFAVTMIGLVKFLNVVLPKVLKIVESNKNVGNSIYVCVLAVIGVLMVINRESLILPILVLSILGVLFLYYLENHEKWGTLIENTKKEYREKRMTINVFGTALAVILFTVYAYSFSKTNHTIGVPLEDYPQYKMAQYILDSGIENPVVVNFHTTDAGIYGLTNTKPPTKWVGDYNAKFPEVEAMYDEYVGGKKADFVLSSIEDLDMEGYELVYSSGGAYYIHDDRALQLYLYAREQ